MSDSFDDLLSELGVDYSNARDRLARDLVEADRSLLLDLINARILARMSKADVAEAMGRHRSVVTNFEKLTSDPHLSTIRRYAAAVGALVRHHVEPTRPQSYRVVTRRTGSLPAVYGPMYGPQEHVYESLRRRGDVSVPPPSFKVFWGQVAAPTPVAEPDADQGTFRCLK